MTNPKDIIITTVYHRSGVSPVKQKNRRKVAASLNAGISIWYYSTPDGSGSRRSNLLRGGGDPGY